VKKEKVKPVEEVIDVVGDFGPGPVKQEDTRFHADENFGMAFDVSALQTDTSLELQDQALMMPPNMGKNRKSQLELGKTNKLFLGQDENDSQQAAEAMIQLGYYSNQQVNQDESIDFLIKKDPNAEPESMEMQPQQQEYQESFDFAANIAEGAGGDEIQQASYYGSFGQQSFNANDFGFQQPQQQMEADYTQLQQQPQQELINDDGGLADLEISDSDDEDDQVDEANTSQNLADTSKEDDDQGWQLTF
jgi:hypothetical protein